MVVSRASNLEFFSSPDEIFVARKTLNVLSDGTNWSAKVFHVTIAQFIIVCDVVLYIICPLAHRAINLSNWINE